VSRAALNAGQAWILGGGAVEAIGEIVEIAI